MKICTVLKQVPDAEASIRTSGSGVDLSGVTFVMDGMDEYGVEEAIRLREAGHQAEIYALALGPEALRGGHPHRPRAGLRSRRAFGNR